VIRAPNAGVRRLVPMVRQLRSVPEVVIWISAASICAHTSSQVLTQRGEATQSTWTTSSGRASVAYRCRKLSCVANPGPRSLSANVKQQHAAQVERLTRRIRELEQGLDAAYSTISDERHPLLKDEGVVVASGLSTPVFRTSSPTHHDAPSVYSDDIINHFGALCDPTVSSARGVTSGTSRYPERWSKRRFVLLRCDRERRSMYDSILTPGLPLR
jgi:hypothetical protein